MSYDHTVPASCQPEPAKSLARNLITNVKLMLSWTNRWLYRYLSTEVFVGEMFVKCLVENASNSDDFPVTRLFDLDLDKYLDKWN